MVRDIIYQMERQIQMHMYQYAQTDDLRILMSQQQQCELERAMWVDNPYEHQSPYDRFGWDCASGPDHPAIFRGVEVVNTVVEMTPPLVVRLASI